MNTLKFLLLAFASCVALFTLSFHAVQAEDEVKYCYGKTISDTIKDSSFMCPFAHFSDRDEGRCISYGQIISRFLNLNCLRDGDCADGTNSFFVCENQKCVYSRTRAIGDKCEGNRHCRDYTGKSSSVTCNTKTKRCATLQEQYTAGEGALCGYSDGSAIIMCSSGNECADYNTEKRCRALKKLGEPCVDNSVRYNCGNDTNGEPLICSSIKYNYLCRTKLTEGEDCLRDWYSCADGYICALSLDRNYLCTRRTSQGQKCYFGDECELGLSCAHPKDDITKSKNMICQPLRNEGEECVTHSCSGGLTCVDGICRAGNLNDPCLRGNTCKNGYVCGPNSICIEGVAIGKPCDEEKRICFSGNSCSRGKCIAPYSISNGGGCASDSDCAEGYCDEYLMVCAKKKNCLRDGSDCTCICSGGKSDLGTCLKTDLCKKYSDALDKCDPSLSSSEYMWFDIESSVFKKCRSQFQAYVRCQAKIYKIADPLSPIRPIPGYNLDNISSASSVATVSALTVATVSIISYMFI